MDSGQDLDMEKEPEQYVERLLRGGPLPWAGSSDPFTRRA